MHITRSQIEEVQGTRQDEQSISEACPGKSNKTRGNAGGTAEKTPEWSSDAAAQPGIRQKQRRKGKKQAYCADRTEYQPAAPLLPVVRFAGNTLHALRISRVEACAAAVADTARRAGRALQSDRNAGLAER